MFFTKKKCLEYVRYYWPNGNDKKRNFKNIRKLYDLFNDNDTYGNIDEQTWSDLDMDSVFSKIDRTYSTIGEMSLYNLFKSPLYDEEKLKKRNDIIEEFRNNKSLRENIQTDYFKLSVDKNASIIDLIKYKLEENKAKVWGYIFLGRILPILIVLSSVFYGMGNLIYLIFLFFANSIISGREKSKGAMAGVFYLGRIVKIAEKISKIEEPCLNEYKKEIKETLKNCSEVTNKLKKILRIQTNGDDFNDFLGSWLVIFLTEDIAYYKLAHVINENKNEIKKLVKLTGEIEALISVSGYKDTLNYYTTPIFVKEKLINIEEGFHPLLKKPVSNSINIKNKGIVLTGTNMSGKSTFLRMMGVNILLAQTFYFTLSKKYESEFVNLVSSISPEDNVAKGKSYYMAEAEALLRIIKALDGELPVFCAIDEIFRGTNPVERIAASSEILKYLEKRNCISIVATHDRELTSILRNSHDFYYFSEDVDDKEGLKFDYKIKYGVSKTRNAIKLLKFIGYPNEIINAAYENIKMQE